MARKKKTRATQAKASIASAMARATEYLTIAQLADRLQVHILTLYRWRRDGEGPKFMRFGRIIRYPLHAVERWENAREG